MLIFRILLGLLGLGVVVFVHELGHFLAARLMGIGVEAFSIGWGKPILKKKIGEVEYRLGLFPLGGYCKMKEDGDFEEAYKKRQEGLELDKTTYYGAHPLRRIISCLAGPIFNFIFAVLVLSAIWGIGGFEFATPSNRIVLSSEINSSEANNPADLAGLRTGDRIISVMGRRTENFNDLREIITINPNTLLPMEVERNNEIISLSIRPILDESRTRGIIGIYNWQDPIIDRVMENSPAYFAGLMPMDRIIRVNGIDLHHTLLLDAILEERPAEISIDYLRNDLPYRTILQPEYGENNMVNLGIYWEVLRYQAPRLSLPSALATGFLETWNTLRFSINSLSMLFRGIDFTQAVSGPVRITYMTGEVAAVGFNQGFGSGISAMAHILALISIALCMMNLLPLPVLDGGMILLFTVEIIRRKPLPPKFVNAFQAAGVIIIAGLMFFALFGDIRYLAGLFSN